MPSREAIHTGAQVGAGFLLTTLVGLVGVAVMLDLQHRAWWGALLFLSASSSVVGFVIAVRAKSSS